MSRGHVVLRALDARAEPPEAGILSVRIDEGDGTRLVLFGFARGEELTEHTSSRPALIQVLRGRLRLVLDGEPYEVAPGDWVRMAAGLAHAVRAEEPSVMLLTLLAGPREEAPPASEDPRNLTFPRISLEEGERGRHVT